MSRDDVHRTEMHWLPDDPDDSWPAGDPALASFAEDLRTIASGPAPEPRPGLVAVMRQGASVHTDVHSDPSPGRRRTMLVKTLVGSLAAKLALGIGVAAASVTAAGAAGVLPDPAQHAMASVVGAATPFLLPDPSAVTSETRRDGAKTPTTVTTLAGNAGAATGTDDDDVAGGGGGDRADNHGACVSAVAKANAGTGAGRTVSSVARSDCGKQGPASSSTSSSSSTTSTTVGGSTTSSTSTSVAGTGSRRSGPDSASNAKGDGGDGKGAGSGKGSAGKD